MFLTLSLLGPLASSAMSMAAVVSVVQTMMASAKAENTIEAAVALMDKAAPLVIPDLLLVGKEVDIHVKGLKEPLKGRESDQDLINRLAFCGEVARLACVLSGLQARQ